MTLGWSDRMAPWYVHTTPRLKGEDRSTYTRRFLAGIKGLGNVHICTVRGKHVVRRVSRGM